MNIGLHSQFSLLRTFLTVVENSGFTSASERLHLTQSTVSHQIARLEESVGRNLIERTTRSFQLTEDGETFRDYAMRIITIADELDARFKLSALKGKVVFGVPEDFLTPALSDVLTRFSQLNPNVRLEIQVGLAEDVRKQVRTGTIDVAIVRQFRPFHVREKIRTEALVWIANRDFNPSRSGNVPLAVVPAPCMYRAAAIRALDAAKRKWQIVLTCGSLKGVVSAVRTGLGVSVYLASDVDADLKVLRREDGFPDLPHVELALISSSNLKNAAAVALKELLKRSFVLSA